MIEYKSKYQTEMKTLKSLIVVNILKGGASSSEVLVVSVKCGPSTDVCGLEKKRSL